MSNFLYQKARDAARHARRVFNGYFKVGEKVVGEEREPTLRCKIELGYTRKWKVEGVEREEFVTCPHLNKKLEALIATQTKALVEAAVVDLEKVADKMERDSIQAVRDELKRLETTHGNGPEAA